MKEKIKSVTNHWSQNLVTELERDFMFSLTKFPLLIFVFLVVFQDFCFFCTLLSIFCVFPHTTFFKALNFKFIVLQKSFH